MSKDWTKTIALAERLVGNYGRTITLAKLATTGDTNKPWRAPASLPALGPSTDQKEMKGVAVGLLKSLGEDFLDGLENVIIVAGDFDAKAYDVIIDGASRWRVAKVETLRPGDKAILHFMGVTQ